MSKQFMEFDVSDFSNTNKAQLSLAEIRRDSYTEGFIKGKEEGRADAIDELKPFIHKNLKGQKFIFVNAEDFKNLDLFEQLKSQN